MFERDYFESMEWTQYMKLQEERPSAFSRSNQLSLVTDQAEILDYMNRTGKKIGVMYYSEYSIVVVDLVRDTQGNNFAYERVLPAVTGSAVVTVPRISGTDTYIILRQFRHSIRDYQLGFPRGFGEPGLTALQNAAKELKEETGAEVINLSELGTIVADSGILGNYVTAVACEIQSPDTKLRTEGIVEVLLLSKAELDTYIAAGKINDGYTLAAWSLYNLKK